MEEASTVEIGTSLSIPELPDELISIIFNHLLLEDVLQTAQVCWAFHRVAMSAAVQSKLNFTSMRPKGNRLAIFNRAAMKGNNSLILNFER